MMGTESAPGQTPPRLRWIGWCIAGFVVVVGLAFIAGYLANYICADDVDPLQRAVELVRGCVIGLLLSWIGVLLVVRVVRLDHAELARRADLVADTVVL